MDNTINIPGVGKLDLSPGVEIGKCTFLELNDDLDAPKARDGYSDHVEFKFATNASEASDLLGEGDIDCVIVDVNLGEGSIKGDEWLVRNIDKLADAKVVVLTGYRNQIENERMLAEHNIPIIDKASSGEDILWRNLRRIPEMKRRDQARAVLHSLNAFSETGLIWPVQGAYEAGDIYEFASDALLDWLENRVDKDTKAIHYGGRTLSIRELIDEIREDTELGKLHIRMFIDLQISELLEQMGSVNIKP